MRRLPPIFVCACAFCVGLAAVFAANIQPPATLTLSTALALTLALALDLELGFGLGRGFPLALLTFAVAGVAAAQSAQRAAFTDCRTSLRDGGRVVAFGAFAAQPLPSSSAVFALDSLGTKMGACAESIRVRTTSVLPKQVVAGAAARVTGMWWAGDAGRSGAFAGVLVLDTIAPLHTPAGGSAALRLRGSAERRVRDLFGREWAMADALLLARTDALDRDLRDRFAASGLSHLLAISGTHVMMIAGIALLVSGILRLPVRTGSLITALTSIAYVLFLGAPYPACRAVIQVLLLLVARTLQRPSNPFALLAVSALAILGFDPLAVAEAGFQLSFAGILGILWLRAPAAALLPTRLPRQMRDALATSLAATLLTTPFAAINFGRIAPVGILANLAAVPIAGLTVPALVLTMLVASVSHAAAAFLAGGCAVLLGALDRTAELAARVPGGHADVSPAAAYAWSAAALVALFIARELAPLRPGRDGKSSAHGMTGRVRWITGSAIACAFVVVLPALAGGVGPDRLEIYAIDVGQGDALVIRTPGAHWILVDAGPRSQDFDAGRARVVPFLLLHGARRIDVLILTHPHADHIGGARAVLDALPVGLIIDPAVPYGGPMYLDLIRTAAALHERWLASATGRELRVDDVVLTFLNRGDESLDGPDDANEFSVVFRLAYHGFGALFLGDAPADVERRVVAREGAGMRSQLLKVAHHGSAGSSSEELLAAVAPEVALVSVGRRNRYGHPAPVTIAHLLSEHVRVLRTDERGTITVRVSRNGQMQVTTAR
jgi:competence protein ComEC